MLSISNNIDFLSFHNASATSEFSFSVSPLYENQMINTGFTNENGQHSMVNVKVLSIKSSVDKYAESVIPSKGTTYDAIKLEIELIRMKPELAIQTLQKYEITISELESHDVVAAEHAYR